MKKNDNILIVGLGLMGGSYALNLSQQNYKIYGYDINLESIKWAYDNDIIDNDYVDESLIQKADYIILCLYPTIVVNWVKKHKHLFKKDVIITDITGVKANIVESIQDEMEENQEFIAMHPMCGRETIGVKYATVEMFKKANLIIVPTKKNTPKGIEFAKNLGKNLRFSNIEILSIEEHDQMISFLSQLPHVISVALMDCRNNDHLARFSGDSFRDLTRIAKINPDLWTELFIMNKDNLIKDIDAFISTMEILKENIQKEDVNKLHEMFIESKRRRLNFEK